MPFILATIAALGHGHAYDDLTLLSDEFDAAHTLTNWQRIYQVEGWGNNVLQQFDINNSRAGHMTMVPYTSSWYAEWRGELTFKTVTGDFVITTDVEPRNRAGTGAPGSQYSLAGIMVRAPRTMTNPAQWTAGGQNYVFLSLGTANNPGSYQFERYRQCAKRRMIPRSSSPPSDGPAARCGSDSASRCATCATCRRSRKPPLRHSRRSAATRMDSGIW
jgi:hypothetical protein